MDKTCPILFKKRILPGLIPLDPLISLHSHLPASHPTFFRLVCLLYWLELAEPWAAVSRLNNISVLLINPERSAQFHSGGPFIASLMRSCDTSCLADSRSHPVSRRTHTHTHSQRQDKNNKARSLSHTQGIWTNSPVHFHQI